MKIGATITSITFTWICVGVLSEFLLPNAMQPSSSAHRELTSGFSSWIAQSIWLKSVEFQQEPTIENTRYVISKTLNWDPNNFFYRSNGAAILAYDLPHQLNENQTHNRVALFGEALQLLQDGKKQQPQLQSLYDYEIGKIHLLKLEDEAVARRYFRSASQSK